MSISERGPIPSNEDFEAILSFIPVLEALPPQEIVHWGGGEKDANGIFTLPFPVYSSTVQALQKALYDHGFIQPFDWPAWRRQAQKYVEHPELLTTARLKTCIKLLTTHFRQERFCEGHLAQMISSGHIMAVLHRIKKIVQPELSRQKDSLGAPK